MLHQLPAQAGGITASPSLVQDANVTTGAGDDPHCAQATAACEEIFFIWLTADHVRSSSTM